MKNNNSSKNWSPRILSRASISRLVRSWRWVVQNTNNNTNPEIHLFKFRKIRSWANWRAGYRYNIKQTSRAITDSFSRGWYFKQTTVFGHQGRVIFSRGFFNYYTTGCGSGIHTTRGLPCVRQFCSSLRKFHTSVCGTSYTEYASRFSSTRAF